LAEPIDAALALLMPGRVPGQIVMDHRTEQVLKIDPFRETIRGDQEALLDVSHRTDARAAFIQRKVARHGLDAQLGKRLAEASRGMIGGGYEPAEDDGVSAFGNDRLEHLQRRVKLRVRNRGQNLGLLNERRKRTALVEPRRRLDIDRIRLVGIVVEHLLFEPVRIGGEAVAERARRCRRR
jgi:hypothetical protein